MYSNVSPTIVDIIRATSKKLFVILTTFVNIRDNIPISKLYQKKKIICELKIEKLLSTIIFLFIVSPNFLKLY